MSLENWLAFVATAAVVLAIPGPTILLVISYSLTHGRKVAGATVAGVALGDFTAMTASMLGLGALLTTYASLFSVLKWVVPLTLSIWESSSGVRRCKQPKSIKPRQKQVLDPCASSCTPIRSLP